MMYLKSILRKNPQNKGAVSKFYVHTILQSKVVQFGNLDNFQVSIKSKGETMKESVSNYSATSTRMNFRLANPLHEMMKILK